MPTETAPTKRLTMANRRKNTRRPDLTLHCVDCRSVERVLRHVMLRAAGARCSACGGRLVRSRELPPPLITTPEANEPLGAEAPESIEEDRARLGPVL